MSSAIVQSDVVMVVTCCRLPQSLQSNRTDKCKPVRGRHRDLWRLNGSAGVAAAPRIAYL
jgi:hypothetical protein